ncbi:hypothetical protein ACLOJK_031203 [Asimina triloba]
MAGILRHLSVKILLISLFLILLLLPNSINGVDEAELQDMISALRSGGYNLFSNAIMMSDLQEDILSGRSFTVFVPTDSALFSLDLRSSADYYLQTLRCHMVTSRRLSASTLRSLPPSGSFLPTLLPHRTVFLSSRAADFSAASQIPTVDGIDVVSPGIFYGRNIAVHGLGGVLSTRAPAGFLRSSRSSVWPAIHADPPALPDIQHPQPAIPSPSVPMSEPPELRTLTASGAPSEILSPYSSMPPEIAATPVLEQPRSPVWPAVHADRPNSPEIQPPLPAISSPSFPMSEPPESADYLASPTELGTITPAGTLSEIPSKFSSMPPEIAATPVLQPARSPVRSAIDTDLPAPPEIQPPLPVISSPSIPISEPPESAGHLAAPPELMAVTPAGALSEIPSPQPAIEEIPVPTSLARGGTLSPAEEMLSPAPAPGIPKPSISRRETVEGGEGLSHGGMQRGGLRPRHLHVDSRNDFF